MKQFKIECTLTELETIMTALKKELEKQDENTTGYQFLSEALAAVADFKTND